MWIGEQVVKDVGVQDGLVGEFLAELVALDAALFLGGGEVQVDLRSIELELPTLDVLFDFPSVGYEG